MASYSDTLPSTAAAPAADAEARRTREGQALMIGAGLLLSTVGVFVEEAGQDPATLVWCRCVFGLLALLAWGAARGRLREVTRLRGRALAAVAGSGALMVLNWGLFFAAIPLCSIAVSTVVFHLQPFWLLVLGAWWLRERISAAQWVATGAAMLGLLLTTGLVEHDAAWWAQRSGYALGLGLSLLGSFVYAGAGLITKLESSPQGRAGPSPRPERDRASSFAMATGPSAVGALALAPWALWHGLPGFGPSWGWLAGLGMLHTGLAYVLLYAGMARLSTGRIAPLLFVYPGAAVLVDWLAYGRALSALQLLGVALIGAALWTLRRRGA